MSTRHQSCVLKQQTTIRPESFSAAVCTDEAVRVVNPAPGMGHAVRILLLVVFSLMSGISIAAEKPLVTLRMELLSIRNRSSGPLPVHIKLGYNAPQILEGDLELSIYDAIQNYTPDDLMATIRYEGITLAGQDYELNLILPPLRTSVTKNWAIEAWFITDDGRIPLSSVQDRPMPPDAHDLLTTSPMERGVLLCSCSADLRSAAGNGNRRFLESALCLDNYNPLYGGVGLRNVEGLRQEGGDNRLENIGKAIIHFSTPWAAKDLPVDPLFYCSFDVVLLSDGGLSSLTEEQLKGLEKWVRAGGSVCLVPDAPMKSQHLEFLRRLFRQAVGDDSSLTLDSDGRLVVADSVAAVPQSHFGLGRAVLLPATESLEQKLTSQELGSVVAFLWKVRKDQPVWNGEVWKTASLVELLNGLGIASVEDEYGVYVTDEQIARRFRLLMENGKAYLTRESLSGLGDDIDVRGRRSLNPRTDELLSVAEQMLLPVDVEMVPIHVIAMILAGYVLTIGPVDYFLLGWLRLRKYTWVLFPVVTLVFTFMTVFIAHAYMGSDDTGGKLVISDIVEGGSAARQTTIETYFMGAQSEISGDHRLQLVVPAENSFVSPSVVAPYGRAPGLKPRSPLHYSGHFPQNFRTTQIVEQWSPVTLRTLSLEPEMTNLPAIDWDDFSLISTVEGNQKIVRAMMANAASAGEICSVAICHSGAVSFLLDGLPQGGTNILHFGPDRNSPEAADRAFAFEQLFGFIPTMKHSSSIFSVVSQLAPEGAASLEDLAFVDPSDPSQWGLVIMLSSGKDFHVFRKLYVEPPPVHSQPLAEESSASEIVAPAE